MFAVDPELAFREFQLLKINHDELVSNFAFKFNLRHYTKAGMHPVGTEHHGRAVQVDPGFPQLTLCLLSTLESKT